MRGPVERQATMLFGVTTEDFVPADHPIRKIRRVVDGVLAGLSGQLTGLYAEGGRHSVPPEHLIKASLLMALYSIRSERQFCERLQYDLLFKWFLGLNITDRAFNHSTFSKNRQRFMAHDLAEGLLGEVVREARQRRLISEDHFSVDGTLLQAWASQKSVRPRDEQEPPSGGGAKNPEVDFHGQQRRNESHVSRTDPEARLAKKARGQEARLSYAGHLLTDNRSGLILDVLITPATGTAERDAALRMLDRQRASRRRATLAADRGYDTRAFVKALRQRQVTPHVAQNNSGNRRSAIDRRTTRHAGYRQSQRVRKRIEECFGWIKTVGGGRKLRYIGCAKNQLWATFTAVAYNLVRIARLEPQSA